MRYPIQLQLLVPMLLVVVLAIGISSAVGAYVGGTWARHEQQEKLRRVISTLVNPSFPLKKSVLQKMTGLSGAEYVVLDSNDQIQSSTLAIEPEEQSLLFSMGVTDIESLSESSTVRIGDRSYLTARTPLRRRTRSNADISLIVLYPEDLWWTATRQAALPPLVAGAVAAIAVVLVTTILARQFLRPVKQLSRQAAVIADGDFSMVPTSHRDDELRDLTIAINRMVEKLAQYEEEVRRSERLRTLGQLGAGMAHQLRNWITGAHMAMEVHQRECPLGNDCESLEVAIRQLTLVESYVKRFLTFGRERSMPHSRVQLDELADEVVDLVQPACQHAKVKLEWSKPTDPLSLIGDGEALQQVIVNLLMNAIEAVSRRSPVENETTCVDHDAIVKFQIEHGDSDQLLLHVVDSGPGPSPEVAEKLFEPFVTEKPDGTGLGLSVARQIVEDHGGSIRWEHSDNRTRFVVELPVQSDRDPEPG